MIGKLFQARNKLHDPDALKKYLQKSELTREDYLNLMRHGFEHHRDKFFKIAQILKLYDKNILQNKLKEYPVLLQLCKIGTAEQVQNLLKIQSLKFLDKKNESIQYSLQNTQKKGQRIQALEIIKVLHNADASLISVPHNKPIILQAIQRQQYQIAEFLIQKGCQVNFPLPEKENLLHVLLRNYNKKFEKQIMKIRSMLIQRGIDEKQPNINNKKPFQLCPAQIEKKIIEQHKSQASLKKVKGDENIRYKGKSEEGPQYARNKNAQYRQKVDVQPIFRIDSKEQLYKMADNVVDKKNKEKQKEMFDRQRQRDLKEKLKQKQKKQKINKRVFTPDELKYFLNQDINYFMQKIEEANTIQKSTLTYLITKIQTKIMEDFGATVKIFGSFATQLCLQQSDIDMVIIPDDKKEHQSSFKLLEQIANLLQSMTEQVQTVKFIKTASVPIIKIQCTKKYVSKKIDITFKDENHNGLISVDLILSYLAIYPHLRALTFVLKKFIYSTNIYDPYSGGLSSYGLILMIVAYLQNQNRERKKRGGPDSSKCPSIAELLIGFLYFYGFKCNYISKQINILDAERAKAQIQATELKYAEQPIYLDAAVDIQLMMYPNDWQPRAKLVIIDPLNPQNNIGRATHKIRQIKTAFEMAYVSIHTNKNCRGKKNCQSYRKISSLNIKQAKYQNLQRPCCIITRMLNSTKSFMVV